MNAQGNSFFHTKVVDGVSPQFLMLCECEKHAWAYNVVYKQFNLTGEFYFSEDGDISSDGATFVDELTEADNYMVGCVPSKTMSVTLMNTDGHLTGHNFKWLKAYIGVPNTESTYTPGSGENTRMVVNYSPERTFYGKTTGFYDASTLVQSGNCVGLYRPYGADSDTANDIYFFMESGGVVTPYKYNASTHAVTSATFSSAFIEKFSHGRSINLSMDEIAEFWENGKYSYYWICAIGTFRVDRPKNTTGKTIKITDAFDIVHELDRDATPTLNHLANTASADDVLRAIAQTCDIYIAHNGNTQTELQGRTCDVRKIENNNYTLRRLVSYCLGSIGANCVVKEGTQTLRVYRPDDYDQTVSENYPIGVDRIEAGTLEIQEYTTGAIDCVSVKGLDGQTTLYPSIGGSFVYEQSGNPFLSSADSTLLTDIARIPTYRPMTLNVLEADPAFQVGDLIVIKPDVNDNTVSYTVPLISQTVRWCGKAYATYDIKGTEDRSNMTYDNYADTNSRVYRNEALGTVKDVSPVSDVSLTGGVTSAVCSVSLEAGTWIVIGSVRFSACLGLKMANIATTSGAAIATAFMNKDYSDNATDSVSIQASAIVTPSSTTTYYLNALTKNSSGCTVDHTYTKLQALRIL